MGLIEIMKSIKDAHIEFTDKDGNTFSGFVDVYKSLYNVDDKSSLCFVSDNGKIMFVEENDIQSIRVF